MSSCSIQSAFDSFMLETHRKPITKSKYRYRLGGFVSEYKDCLVSDIGDEIVGEWFERLKKKKYASATLALNRAVFKAFFNFCRLQGFTGENPADHLPHWSDKPKRIITANEEHLAIALETCDLLSTSADAYARRNALIFALGAISGCRRSNLEQMPYQETVKALEHPIADDVPGAIYTVATEGKQGMEIVFGAWHASLIRRYLAIRPTTDHDRLLVHLHPKRGSYGNPLGARGIGWARAKVCAAAGVPIITYTEMRKLKGTKIARKYGLELAAQALGHRSGTRVIREFYYDPDVHATRLAIMDTFDFTPASPDKKNSSQG